MICRFREDDAPATAAPDASNRPQELRIPMRSLILAAMMGVALMAAVTPPLSAAPPDGLPAGTTVVVNEHPETPGVQSWTVTSAYQAGANQVEYLLPSPLVPGKRYPVVYCLPVNAGTKGNWGHPLEVAQAYDLANRFGVILVCPAYAVVPWYGDNPQNPQFRQSSYLTDVVMPLVESRLPALAEPRGRFLVGFSKSALGGMAIFLRRTDQFAKIAVFENYWGRPTADQWATWGFADCYGTRENFAAWDPQQLIDDHSKELVGGPTRIVVLTGGPKPRLGVDALVGQFKNDDIPIQYIEDDHWNHNWTCGWLPMAVASLMQSNPDTPPAPAPAPPSPGVAPAPAPK